MTATTMLYAVSFSTWGWEQGWLPTAGVFIAVMGCIWVLGRLVVSWTAATPTKTTAGTP